MKILIVDDSLLDRKLLINVLKKNNITNDVLQAGDGDEGIRVLSANYKDIGVILLDWQMPKVDGISFMKAVVKVPEVANIPIIMITASGTEDNKRLAREANPNLAGYVVKPYKVEDLVTMIKSHLK